MGVKTLLFTVAEDYFFVSHRMTLARMARDAGYRVVVATPVSTHRATIEKEGFRVVPIALKRGLRNPLADLRTVAELVRIYRDESPDIVHHLSLKAVLLGSIAARIVRLPLVVNALTGLGILYTGEGGGIARLVRGPVTAALRRLLKAPGRWTLVQNSDDLATIRAAGIGVPERTVLIKGSGVDIGKFSTRPEADGVPVAAMVSRLVGLKGVPDLVEAARHLKTTGTPIRVALVGSLDPYNPTAISQDQIESWVREGVVEWWGQRSDIPKVWAEAHIAVQPSRGGEGIPKSLLEAGACGRPLVTTDVPGCRELVTDGVDGFVVPPKSPKALAEALRKLAEDASLRARLGRAARTNIETHHTDVAVAAATLEVYRRALAA